MVFAVCCKSLIEFHPTDGTCEELVGQELVARLERSVIRCTTVGLNLPRQFDLCLHL